MEIVPEPPLPTHIQDKHRLDALLARTWAIAEEATHPLGRLQGVSLGQHRLLALLGPKNNVGSRYFQLLVVNEAGAMSEDAIALGLHNSGPYPAFNWVDVIRYDPLPRLGGEEAVLFASGGEAEERLFESLSQLVPPGGHLMVEYESPAQRESERILGLDYPPVTSPLGYLLFRVGCRSFRDWYISEGGREGPRKLQGYKPLNDALAVDKAESLRRQVEECLAKPESPGHGDYGRIARRLANAVLEALDEEQGRGKEEQDSALPPVP